MELAFLVVDGLLFALSACIMLFAGTLFLDIRRKDLYGAVGLALVLVVLLCPAVPASPWRVVTGALVLVVPMLAFACDGILRRLLVVACLVLLALAADVASLVVWYVLSAPAWASSIPQEGGWGAMVIAHSVRVVAMVGLLAPFSFAYRRMSHLHTDRGALAFGGFIVVQLILLMIAVGTLMDDEVVPSWYVMGVALATLTSALVDVRNAVVSRGGREDEGTQKHGRSGGLFGPSTLACRHGWGLQILEVLALRYNGTFECGREGEHEFRATLMLMNEAQERS